MSYKHSIPTPKDLDRGEMMDHVCRASRIMGQVLEDQAIEFPGKPLLTKWLLYIARGMWFLVEGVVPKRTFHEFISYWLNILTFLSSVTWVLVHLVLTGSSDAAKTGSSITLVACWVVFALVFVVRKWVYRTSKLKLKTGLTISILYVALVWMFCNGRGISVDTLRSPVTPLDRSVLVSLLLVGGLWLSWLVVACYEDINVAVGTTIVLTIAACVIREPWTVWGVVLVPALIHMLKSLRLRDTGNKLNVPRISLLKRLKSWFFSRRAVRRTWLSIPRSVTAITGDLWSFLIRAVTSAFKLSFVAVGWIALVAFLTTQMIIFVPSIGDGADPATPGKSVSRPHEQSSVSVSDWNFAFPDIAPPNPDIRVTHEPEPTGGPRSLVRTFTKAWDWVVGKLSKDKPGKAVK